MAWDPETSTEMVNSNDVTASGVDAMSALSAALARVVEAQNPAASGSASEGLSATFRAEGMDLACLFGGLVDSLIAQVEDLDMAATTASVNGLVRSDHGYVAWGTVDLDRNAPGSPVSIALAGPPRVTESAGGVTIHAELERSGRRPR